MLGRRHEILWNYHIEGECCSNVYCKPLTIWTVVYCEILDWMMFKFPNDRFVVLCHRLHSKYRAFCSERERVDRQQRGRDKDGSITSTTIFIGKSIPANNPRLIVRLVCVVKMKILIKMELGVFVQQKPSTMWKVSPCGFQRWTKVQRLYIKGNK